jgi:hypothetical protein
MDPTEEIVPPVEGEAPPDTKVEGEEAPPEKSIFDAVDEALKPVTHEAKPEGDEHKADGEDREEDADADKHEMDNNGRAKRDAKGRFIPKDKDAVPAEKDGETPVGKVKVKADPVNDPIDPTLSERTRERITTLATRVKDAEKASADNEAIFKHISDTGVNPTQFAQTIGFLRLYHSKDPADTRRAYDALKVEVRYLATKLGITDDAAVDFLSDFPDLKAEVASGRLSDKNARELALTRTRTKNDAEAQARTTAEAKMVEAHAKAKADAITELNGIGAELRKDPEYGAKYAILVPQLKQVFEGLHPSQWGSTFRRAYAGLKVAAPARREVPDPEAPANRQQPMRPNKGAPAGSQNKQPGSMLDAVNAALEQN